MSKVLEIHLNNELSIESLINELKAHISKELVCAVIEKPMCVKQAAEYLGIHENTVYKWIKSKHLPVELIHRVNGCVYFFPSELRDFIKRS
jgi:excisionase family DNA binding protein